MLGSVSSRCHLTTIRKASGKWAAPGTGSGRNQSGGMAERKASDVISTQQGGRICRIWYLLEGGDVMGRGV